METRILPCRLTDTELLERGAQVADLVRELEAAEDAKKEAASEAKAKIDSLDGRIGSLARELRERMSYRSVEVKREKDFGRNCEEVVRLDTGEVIETRALDPGERQVELLSIDGGKRGEVAEWAAEPTSAAT